jgi:hypothetical protein
MKNSFTQLSPINKIFKCFLMFPYPASERQKGFWPKVHLLFPAALTIFSIVFGFFIKPMFTWTVISVLVAYVVLFGEFLMFLLGTYGAYFNIKDQKMFYDVLDCIDKILVSRFSTIISYRKFLIKSVLKLFLFFIIMVTLKIIVLIPSNYNLMYYSYLFIPSLFNQLKCFQITFYLNIMHEKLKLLLEKLEESPELFIKSRNRKITIRKSPIMLENFHNLKRIYGNELFILNTRLIFFF